MTNGPYIAVYNYIRQYRTHTTCIGYA